MKKLTILTVVLLLSLLSSGCWRIRSAGPTTNDVSGEAWYVKTKVVLGLIPAKSDIYFCPAPGQKGPPVCRKATIHEALPPAPPAYAQPQGGYQQPPPQPGYQQQPPPQQQPGGFQQQPPPQQQQQQPGGYRVPPPPPRHKTDGHSSAEDKD